MHTSDLAPADRSPGSHLAGTATLLRFALRRDRFRLPVWLLGITVLSLWFGAFLSDFAASEEQRQDMTRFMRSSLRPRCCP